jgi:hypothetical protein
MKSYAAQETEKKKHILNYDMFVIHTLSTAFFAKKAGLYSAWSAEVGVSNDLLQFVRRFSASLSDLITLELFISWGESGNKMLKQN